eukprot:851005-Rhodomonas_salina.3
MRSGDACGMAAGDRRAGGLREESWRWCWKTGRVRACAAERRSAGMWARRRVRAAVQALIVTARASESGGNASTSVMRRWLHASRTTAASVDCRRCHAPKCFQHPCAHQPGSVSGMKANW